MGVLSDCSEVVKSRTSAMSSIKLRKLVNMIQSF